MPPTTTEIAELKRTHETIHAVAELFTAVAAHNSAVSLAAEIAVKSTDLEAIRNVRRVLDLMTETLQRRQQPIPTPRLLVES